MADVGVAATDEIVEAVRSRARRGESLRDLVKAGDPPHLRRRPSVPAGNGAKPHVMLIVGVNGTGKTTTVGKLANQLKSDGQQAADLRRRYVPRRRGRSAADLGRSRRRRHGPCARGIRSGGGRVRRAGREQVARARHGAGRHGRPPAHAHQPDERARQDSPRRRARSAGRAARSAARARRDRRSERSRAGARVHQRRRRQRDRAHQAGWHRQGRRRRRHRARSESADPVTSASARASTICCRSRRPTTSRRCSRKSGRRDDRRRVRRDHDAARAVPRGARTGPHHARIPMVGAVVVSADGVVVGHGWHERAGEAHAEVNALDEAGTEARGGTIYVTLEPCCHTGRTGPCTRRIIDAGIARVVAAMRDPDPRVSGRGFAELRAPASTCDEGLCEAEARAPERGVHLRQDAAAAARRPESGARASTRRSRPAGERTTADVGEANRKTQQLRAAWTPSPSAPRRCSSTIRC